MEECCDSSRDKEVSRELISPRCGEKCNTASVNKKSARPEPGTAVAIEKFDLKEST